MAKCRELTPKELDEERTRLNRRPRYEPGEDGRTSVQFRFNLDTSRIGDSLLFIQSNRSESAVYWGPYMPVLSVEIDRRLTTDQGYDNLEFLLMRLTARQICTWTNESDYPYWRKGATVEISFLPEAGLDEKGLTKQHEVTIR